MTVHRVFGLSSPGSVILEGAYTGALIYWFWYRSDTGMQWAEAYLWIYGVLALLAFTATMVNALLMRREHPWRWARSLAYCLLVLLAMLISNTDIVRLLVFLGFFAYALIVRNGQVEIMRERPMTSCIS